MHVSSISRLLMIGVAATIVLLATFTRSAEAENAPGAEPFKLERRLLIPEVPWGPYSDYLATDVPGGRVFATPQAAHAVAVFDTRVGKLITLITGIGNPHGVFYSNDSKMLFVDDGEAGAVKVFDGTDFILLKSIPTAVGTNGLTYDPTSGMLYVNSGGSDAGLDHSLITVIQTRTAEKVAEVRMEALTLEASIIDAEAHRLYINLEDKNAVAVLDLKSLKVVDTWVLRHSQRNMPMAFDRDHRRLYLGCRDSDMHGTIAVLDMGSGRELDPCRSADGWTPSGTTPNASGFMPRPALVTLRLITSCPMDISGIWR